VLKSHHSQSQAIQIEPTTRYFIAEGIRTSVDHSVHVASLTLQQLRMVKTQEELAIMRCANQITARAIGTVQHHGIHIGMSEQTIEQRMTEALHRVGLTETWVVALVDANAAFPHGQPGKPHDVTPSSLVLIDTGGQLYDYQSDTTRTFFIDPAAVNHTIKAAWRTVHNAQQAVLDNIKKGDSCAHVDLTARNLISDAGWGDAFTHRLGHGIGLEMHESRKHKMLLEAWIHLLCRTWNLRPRRIRYPARGYRRGERTWLFGPVDRWPGCRSLDVFFFIV
jgi:Xaa-Pro aminopeptidase